MAETFISGNSGACVLGSANEHNPHFNTWSATFTREQHDVTAFGDTGRRRIPGLADISGSAGGFMTFDSSDTGPGVFQDAHGNVAAAQSHLMVLTLATGCTYTFNGNITDVAISSTMGGDATITMNFVMAGGAEIQGTNPAASSPQTIETWDETG